MKNLFTIWQRLYIWAASNKVTYYKNFIEIEIGKGGKPITVTRTGTVVGHHIWQDEHFLRDLRILTDHRVLEYRYSGIMHTGTKCLSIDTLNRYKSYHYRNKYIWGCRVFKLHQLKALRLILEKVVSE